MIGLIGRKVGMTQLFDEKGDVLPVTVIQAGPCTVTEVRSADKNGYAAVQLGFGTNKEFRFTRPVLGQFKKRNLPPSRKLREFRTDGAPAEGGSAYEVGQSLTVALFEKGEHVDVRGVTKGRGFAGVVKRHKFAAGHASHGPTAGKQPGSIGASAYPSRVVKGKRLPGRMGGVNLTIKNLEVVAVDAEQHVMMVLGAIPGPPNGLVFVTKREG
ncbi:MAG: 50S ribosomal protein L3 [Candidatus Eisenbacteria bacterium]|uniref:Large ribosomal subunit protein uL3 n=1 Tax=Eiseniibacteriota bacterium TaxID=2212470 RepID=A0A9D6L6V5_UNCEI|nr:50S ribosomal protein L3 [Candidatus Eisenbacteria bacterium]MBI3538924.1 50S ribosomal protein L3 [Candidatus Eisenbacteria bacterium]